MYIFILYMLTQSFVKKRYFCDMCKKDKKKSVTKSLILIPNFIIFIYAIQKVGFY
jgi:hypothetical protein